MQGQQTGLGANDLTNSGLIPALDIDASEFENMKIFNPDIDDIRVD